MLTRFWYCFATSFLAVAVFSLLNSAHSRQSGEVPTGRVPADSVQTPTWDSIYAGIQAGFVKLRPIFEKGCFDCHSDQTHYPWYHNLPGIRGMIDKDIRAAHKRLDMSKGFPFGNRVRPADDLSRIRGALADHEMPPWDYRFMHWNANPSTPARDSVISWIDSSLRLLAAHGQYPFGQPDEALETDQGEEGADSSE